MEKICTYLLLPGAERKLGIRNGFRGGGKNRWGYAFSCVSVRWKKDKGELRSQSYEEKWHVADGKHHLELPDHEIVTWWFNFGGKNALYLQKKNNCLFGHINLLLPTVKNFYAEKSKLRWKNCFANYIQYLRIGSSSPPKRSLPQRHQTLKYPLWFKNLPN